ncbi:hypothetical protein Tco_1437793 [Tanacetum coccineum]
MGSTGNIHAPLPPLYTYHHSVDRRDGIFPDSDQPPPQEEPYGWWRGGVLLREAWSHFDRMGSGNSSGASDPIRIIVYAQETYLQANHTQQQLQSTLIQNTHQMVETLRVIRDMRREMSDMQAELLALREQRRIARQSGPEARIPDHQEASGDADSHI